MLTHVGNGFLSTVFIIIDFKISTLRLWPPTALATEGGSANKFQK